MENKKVLYFGLACNGCRNLKAFVHSLVTMGRGFLCLSVLLFIVLLVACNRNHPTDVIPLDPPVYSPIDYLPSWAPDNKNIVYAHWSETSRCNELWIVNIDNLSKRFLCVGSTPVWDPNNDRIVYMNYYGICVIKPNGDSMQFLTRGASPSLTPDSKRIAYFDSSEIWIMNSDGTGKRVLWPNTSVSGGGVPMWSPNMQQIVYDYVYYGYTSSVAAIFISDTLLSNPVLLYGPENTNTCRWPSWSPDGNKVIFSWGEKSVSKPQICIINKDGSNLVKLTPEGGETPAWSPDGLKIAYCRYNGLTDPTVDSTNCRLWIMNINGTNKQQITFP